MIFSYYSIVLCLGNKNFRRILFIGGSTSIRKWYSSYEHTILIAFKEEFLVSSSYRQY